MIPFDRPRPPYDADELMGWAEMYGHPEEWAKRAQAAHNRAEELAERVGRLEHALELVAYHERGESDHRADAMIELARKALEAERA